MNSQNQQDISMEHDSSDVKQNGSKFPKPKFDGKIKKKKGPRIVRGRLVSPKNAVACINEICKDSISFKVLNAEHKFGEPVCVSAELNGRSFVGRGSSQDKAKHAAAEAVLASMVAPSGQNREEDTTPWKAIASFAIYRLFNEWAESKIWAQEAVPPPDDSMTGMKIQISTTGARTTHMGGANDGGQLFTAITSYVPALVKNMKPAKQVPDNASDMHPVMLLHQMRPGRTYKTEKLETDVKNVFVFQLSSEIDNQVFTGQGANTKKAKVDLAKKAVQQLFDVVSTWNQPE